jgi:hypothetical protein
LNVRFNKKITRSLYSDFIMRRTNLFFGLLFSCFLVKKGVGQVVSNDRLKELFRSSQLLGTYQTGSSLSVNANQVSMKDLDSALGNQKYAPLQWKIAGNAAVSFLPVSITQQYNSKTPYDWNNAPMIPARGYQSVFSLGAFAAIGKHITIQIAPEFVSAENKPFETFSQELGDAAWTSYYKFLNTTDIPEQFGINPYHKILPGQSSIRYNTDQFSFGLSTENLWWGPGYRNALVMSTNAPGFLHATINTLRPIKTGIGEFEGQIIAGTLSNSGILSPRINSVDSLGNFVYQPKNGDTRYITGMVLSWQPKWTPNLFLGISKASYLYTTDLSNPFDALPLQGFFGRAITANEGNGKKASMGSLFFRYVMPKEHAEIYMELGRKDISLMPWNIVQNQQYRRAYVAGIRKLFDSKNDSHIQLTAELTQMQAPTADLIHQPDSWYTDQYIRQGYTNMGRSIGAGIGPGSNSQTLEISWIKGLKRIGLQFERLRHNSDFYYYAFERIGDFRRHWIDISTTLKADWNYKNIFFSGQFAVVRSYNYEWLIVQYIPDYFVPGNEVLNFSGKLAVSYRF